LLDDLLGVGLDLLLFFFDDLGQLSDSFLESSLLPLNLFLLSDPDHLVYFLGGLRGDGDFGVLGFLLNLLGLNFEFLDSVVQVDDLGVDFGVFLLFFIEFSVFHLNLCLGGGHFRLKGSDFVLDLGLLFLLLD